MLVFCRADMKSLNELNNLLEKLQLNTSLAINKKMSKIFFSTGCKNKAELARILGCGFRALPTKYLGLPLSILYLKPRNFGGLLDKVRSRVEGWMTISLSFADRVELTKSVLTSTMIDILDTVILPPNFCY